ncbi:DoxX family protein [bacterium]|nr:DoxX family protein [bacterium]
MVITGWVLSLLPMPLFAMSTAMKFLQPKEVTEGMTKFGWPMEIVSTLGVIEGACLILYIIPRTSVLGAILLTGYLGGAIATHVRVGDAWIMPFLFGVLLWLGLYLRDYRLRALVPFRSKP